MSVPRALVCAPRTPEFDREGGSRRTFHLIEMLLDQGWAVSFVAENGAGSERYARVLRQRGVDVYAGPDTPEAGDEYLEAPAALIAAGRFDLAIVAFWYAAETYLPLIRSLSPRTPLIVDSVDLHFLRHSRSAFQGLGARGDGTLDDTYAQEMRRELNVYAAADAVLTVSRKEAELVDDFIGAPRAYEVPDTDDVPPSPLVWAERRGMLFIGNFHHPPNAQALEYLCGDVLPMLDDRLLAAHPVAVVGNALETLVPPHARGRPGVTMVGWVPSIVPYLHGARLSLVPLRHGAGTKRKLIQACMAGTPSVSTAVGVEGLDLQDGEHLLVADDPAAFARAIERLLQDRELWQRLSTGSREQIAVVHGRDAVRRRFREVVAAVLARRRAERSLTPAPPRRPGSPVVDVETGRADRLRIWTPTPKTPGMDLNLEGHLAMLTVDFPKYVADYDYPARPAPTDPVYAFHDDNRQFGGLDSRALFVMLRKLRPARMIEIGLGFSSLLTADVNRRFLDGTLDFTCIEPHPRESLRAGVPGISTLVERRVQDVPLSEFDALGPGDILFVDSVHMSKTGGDGGDVNCIVFDILPRLRPGAIVHFHDIFLRGEYPERWVLEARRSWNEQYVVHALLMYSKAFTVLFGSTFAAARCPEALRTIFGGAPIGGGSLWLRKNE